MRKNVVFNALVIAGAMAMASNVTADDNADHGFNYVEAGLAFYPGADLVASDQDLVGAELRAAFEVNDQIAVIGGGQILSDDADLQTFHVGPAYHFDDGHGGRIYAAATLEYTEFEFSQTVTVGFDPFTGQEITETVTADADDIAPGVRVGSHREVADNFELSSEIRVITGDLDYWGFRVAGHYAVDEQFDVYAMADLFDGEFGVGTGVRWNY